MKFLFNFLIFCSMSYCAFAQVNYNISGTVTDTTGTKIQSATVFIAGTEKMTSTKTDGTFSFGRLKPGNYDLVVNMLGYSSVKQAVTINNHDEAVKLVVHGKNMVLKEVVIGAKKQSAKDMKRFTKFFLGYRNTNPQVCKILTPELINFVRTDTALTATSDDFLIIENRYLGYKVRYLLKSFWCKPNNYSFFDGDFTFEPLSGTLEQQKFWDKNRKSVYDGSMMHFLRALYAGTTRKEGFLVYRSTTDDAMVLEANPSDPQQFVTHRDSNFISVNIKPMVMVVSDREKAAKPDIYSEKPPKKHATTIGLPYKFTLYKLMANVDSRGSINDRKFIFNFGYWRIFGVGDQLPFEYNPD